jgi:hypothetical protein
MGSSPGPTQSEENPLGVGGLELQQWIFPLEVWRRQQGAEGGEINASTPVVEEARSNVGATVITHHPREPLEMEGGTTFVFVTDDIES